jgi:uncharacterized protein YndB with AHSA1/START domain
VPKELIWKAWTMPEHLKKWFTPSPRTTIDCEIDRRPGGIFRTVMRSPEGEEFPNLGCYLEIIENEKLVWTNTLLPGYRPAHPPSENDFFFTATIALAAQGNGTKYGFDHLRSILFNIESRMDELCQVLTFLSCT